MDFKEKTSCPKGDVYPSKAKYEPPTAPPPTIPPKTPFVEGFACDFDDQTTCGWINNATDNFDWVLKKGPTGISNSGPGSDHTTGRRYLHFQLFYIFLNIIIS